jgi:hypothetical protein
MPDEPELSEFGQLLTSLVRRYGTREALGQQIGMSGSRVGRAIDGQYTFNVKNCLKLARATGESPSGILRAAGKHDIADLLQHLFGPESLGAATFVAPTSDSARHSVQTDARQTDADNSAERPMPQESTRDSLQREAVAHGGQISPDVLDAIAEELYERLVLRFAADAETAARARAICRTTPRALQKKSGHRKHGP